MGNLDGLGYRGTTCVVTGGSSGMGEAVVRILGDLGAAVHVVDIQPPKVPHAAYHPTDLAEPDQVAATAEKLRRLEIDKALEQAGADDLFVTSPLLLFVTAGDRLDHQIVARSRKGGIKYSLTNGPDGLTVTPDGKVGWLVPGSLEGQEVEAVVTVEDATGQERFRKITIKIH